jgi:hypothetical protein
MPVRLGLFEVRFVCGGTMGTRHVWAPDERSAVALLRQHPSTFGLAHESVPVARAVRLDLRELRAERAA